MCASSSARPIFVFIVKQDDQEGFPGHSNEVRKGVSRSIMRRPGGWTLVQETVVWAPVWNHFRRLPTSVLIDASIRFCKKPLKHEMTLLLMFLQGSLCMQPYYWFLDPDLWIKTAGPLLFAPRNCGKLFLWKSVRLPLYCPLNSFLKLLLWENVPSFNLVLCRIHSDSFFIIVSIEYFDILIFFCYYVITKLWRNFHMTNMLISTQTVNFF